MAASVDLRRCVLAETVGTALLLATVIGSGIMGETLAGGNVAGAKAVVVPHGEGAVDS
jgi:glycerol uptake facilitator-like aquaporin